MQNTKQPIKLYNLTNQTCYKLKIKIKKMDKIKAFFASEKFKKWAKNSLVFLAPALVIFLTAIQNGVPVKQAMYSVYLWGLNVLIDALKKVTGQTSIK